MNKLVVLTGMSHCGKSTMLKRLKEDNVSSLLVFRFDDFCMLEMYEEFLKLNEQGFDVVNRACKIIFGSARGTSLDIMVEGVAFMSKDVRDMFKGHADMCGFEYRFFKLIIDYDTWVSQVPDEFSHRRNKELYNYWIEYYTDKEVEVIRDSKPIEEFLRRNSG